MKWKSIKVESSSPVEGMICKILDELKVKYHREVAFRNFKSKYGNYYRFDFYFPERNLIIEYDGSYHKTDRFVKKNDKIKNKYCKEKKIRLVRLNKKHLKNLKKHIKKALI